MRYGYIITLMMCFISRNKDFITAVLWQAVNKCNSDAIIHGRTRRISNEPLVGVRRRPETGSAPLFFTGFHRVFSVRRQGFHADPNFIGLDRRPTDFDRLDLVFNRSDGHNSGFSSVSTGLKIVSLSCLYR